MPVLPQPVSVRDALEISRTDIEVSDSTQRWCGPFDEFAHAYRIVSVAHFEELQELRILPDTLSEKEVADALVADDAIFRNERAGSGNCECKSHQQRSVQRSHQNLAELVRASDPLMAPEDL